MHTVLESDKMDVKDWWCIALELQAISFPLPFEVVVKTFINHINNQTKSVNKHERKNCKQLNPRSGKAKTARNSKMWDLRTDRHSKL